MAYVSNYGGGAFNTLAVVDLVAQKPLPATISERARTSRPRFAAGKVWFTAEAAKSHRQLRSHFEQSRLDLRHRTGSHAHDLCRSGPDTHRHHQHQRRYCSIIEKSPARTSASLRLEVQILPQGTPAGARPPGPPSGPPEEIGIKLWSRSATDPKVLTSRPTARKSGSPTRRMAPSPSLISPPKKVTSARANVRGANRLKFTPTANWLRLHARRS